MSCRSQSGFSIIELMIAMMLGLLLIAMVVSVFLTSNQNYTQDNAHGRMQENGRFALRLLSNELTMAHYWGGMLNPGTGDINDDTGIAAGDSKLCGRLLDTSEPLIIGNEATATDINTDAGCIAASSVYQLPDGSWPDMLVVKRTSGTNHYDDLGDAAQDNKLFLYTNSNAKNGRLVINDGTSGSAPTANETRAWEFSPRIFFICDEELDDANNLNTIPPSLCVAQWDQDEGRIRPRVYIEGIEDMQISFGLDRNGDGLPDEYVRTLPVVVPPITLAIAVTAKIEIMARSLIEIPGYKNEKTYNLIKDAVGAYAPMDHTSGGVDDRYYRRIFSNTVMLRNTAYLRSID